MSASPQESESDPYATRASMFERLRRLNGVDREVAWETFNERYTPVIAAFAARCHVNRQDIDDIVQDVITAFVGVHREFVYDPARGRFRGWLKTCTVRAAIRRAGKNARFNGVPLDELSDVEMSVEPVWSDVWEHQRMAVALSLLRKQTGESKTFRAFEQYALNEKDAAIVARDLGMSVDGVHQAKTRMTRLLREIVGQLAEDD